MIKKIIKVGNSYGVTLSSVFIKTTKLKTGDLVDIDEAAIIPAKKGTSKKMKLEGVTPDFVRLVDETIQEYKPALKILSKK